MPKWNVSIHASRCWEAMLTCTAVPTDIFAFQSTPPVAGRRCYDILILCRRCFLFQSTPPVAGRRCALPAGAGWTNIARFNPRLPLLGGDAAACRVYAKAEYRFNPRLPLLGGDALRPRHRRGDADVSIHASRCWEAMLMRGLVKFGKPMFQSTPPVAGRRCPEHLVADCHRAVSIHASRCWEAMPRQGNLDDDAGAVSIHASRCWEAMPSVR